MYGSKMCQRQPPIIRSAQQCVFRAIGLVLAVSLSAASLSQASARPDAKPADDQAAAKPLLLSVPLQRGVDCPVYWMPHKAAKTTLVLFPGGSGVLDYDAATNTLLSQDFLPRSRELFQAAGFNVAVVGNPRDRADLNLAYRKGDEHRRDIRAVLLHLKQLKPAKLWLVGTSRGTLSAANAAISYPQLVSGLVLTSSIVSSENKNSVFSLALENIRAPTLVVHHLQDMCRSCPPEETKEILTRLTSAPRKGLVFIGGGGGASGPPCQSLHYHGFIHQEAEAVERIAAWIRAAPGR